MAQSLLWIEILAAFLAVGNGILNPCLSSLISQAAGKSNRGTILGAQQGIGSLARIIAPPINNYLVGVNSAIPFMASGCLMGVAFGLSVRLEQPRPKATIEGALPLSDGPIATVSAANELPIEAPFAE